MTYDLTATKPYTGPNPLKLDAGKGSYRAINVSGAKSNLLRALQVLGPDTYKPGDDYSGVALLSGGNGLRAVELDALGLHVAVRGAYDSRALCLASPVIDGDDIGKTQDWVFGVLTAQIGDVTIDHGLFVRGGSKTNPNKSHRLYLSEQTPLALTASEFRGNWAGRDVQVYGQNPEFPDAKPGHWYIGHCTFEKLLLPAGQFGSYASIQTNPHVLSEIEDTSVENDYCCIEAHGDTLIRGGMLKGKGAGVRAMRDGIRIELHGVDVACGVPVDTQGLSGVRVSVK